MYQREAHIFKEDAHYGEILKILSRVDVLMKSDRSGYFVVFF